MKRSSLLLMTVIFMDLLTGMEFDLFVPSFPEIKSQFHLTPFWVEALLSVNFVGYCLSMFLVGSLADRYGRKPIIILGLVIFIIGSFFCLSAASYPVLLAGRFLQGLGIAAPMVLSFLIIADTYSLKNQQYYMAIMNAVKNTSVAIAPVLGSYITLYFHWQGNFRSLFYLGLLTLALSLIFIPDYKIPEPPEDPSFQGYLSLFRSKPLMLLMFNIIVMFVPYWIFVGMSPLLYMRDLGVSLAHFGYYQGVLALLFGLGSLGFGLIMHRYTQKNILYAASLIYIISLICMVPVTFLNSANPLVITLAFIPFILSQVIPSNVLVPLCLNYLPPAKARVSAVLQGSQLIISALSLELAGHLYQGSFAHIGIIILVFMVAALLSHQMVLKNRRLMKNLPT